MRCDSALPQMWGMVLQVQSWCVELGGMCKAVLAFDACRRIRETMTLPRKNVLWEPVRLCEMTSFSWVGARRSAHASAGLVLVVTM